MINQAKSLSYFFLPTLVALLVGGFFLVMQPKADIHLFVNAHHHPFADAFFATITHFGEGWFFLLAIPLLIFVGGRSAIHFLIAALLTLAFTALFKQLLFAGEPRPAEYFKNLHELYFVPGVDVHSWNSFPSGHTMAAFAIWLSFATYLKKNWAIFTCFVIAFLVGYSRMYLSQHFLIDVEFGAILGIVAASLGYYFSTLFSSPMLDKPLISKSL